MTKGGATIQSQALDRSSRLRIIRAVIAKDWLEHRWRETPDLPDAARTRRYGDTAITTLRVHP